MQKLYLKNEICHAIIWIVIYVLGTSVTENISEDMVINKSITLAFHIILCFVLIFWINKNGLFKKFGICRPDASASKYLYYVPLLIIISCNFWFGVTLNYGVMESVIYAGSMICVGFLEEIIFRGCLFQAMAKDSVKVAIIVSSVTFGMGHIINLLNGNSADPLATLCQIFYATAIGFLFVIVVYRGGSLWPCIITHSAVNAISVFSDESDITVGMQIISASILTIISVAYALILMKTLPATHEKNHLQEINNE